MMRKPALLAAALLAALVFGHVGCRRGTTPTKGNPPTQPPPTSATNPETPAQPSPAAAKGKQVTIDLDKAVDIAMPAVQADLQPVAFRTPDGKEGWEIRIPGNRPIATPAYADGLLFVGGGYGSHEFYAFDAKTGKVAWQMTTKDDGPTAAVVEDGCVAFNTESCTVVVADAKTGKVLWEEWLGDPLMSQPAIAKGKLYMAYPNSKGDHRHHLLCADLKTGRHLWEQGITGDIVSAPVVDEEKVYFTCFDGTSFCVGASDGAVAWKKEGAGTSAPVVAEGQVMFTAKRLAAGKAVEGMLRMDAKQGDLKDKELLAEAKAEYLEAGKGGGVQIFGSKLTELDSSVGFGVAPQSAHLETANSNLGVQTVAGAWAYQGSRAAYYGGNMINAQGPALNCYRAASGECNWTAQVKGAQVRAESQVFSPPSLGKKNMYLVSAQGHLACVGQADGQVGFLYATKLPMAFQPALAEGNLYAGTANGMLICLKTGNADASGWTAWGGNAQHNKKE